MSFIFFGVLLLFIFWIWALIDCLTSDLEPQKKLIWTLIIIFFHFLGALLYMIFGTSKGEKLKFIRGKNLYRSGKNKIIGGVCGGIGEYLGIDPVVIRLIWLFFVFVGGYGIIAYILAWIIIPEKK